MNKEQLKVEITREELLDFEKYKFFYSAFINENKDKLVCFNRVFDSEYTGLHPYQEIYYCKEALEKIEKIEVVKKQMEIDILELDIEKSEKELNRLKNRNLIQRILNK